MRCHDIRELLSSYIDGMLDSSQTALVEGHLAACPDCRKEYDDLATAVELVRELPEIMPPPEFRARLRREILSLTTPAVKQSKSGLLRRLAIGKWSGALAAAAVICLTVGITALWYNGHSGGILDPVFRHQSARQAQNQADGLTGGSDNIQFAGKESTGADTNDEKSSPGISRKDAPSAQGQLEKKGGVPPLPEVQENGTNSEVNDQVHSLAAPGEQKAEEQSPKAPVSTQSGEAVQRFSISAVPDAAPEALTAGGDDGAANKALAGQIDRVAIGYNATLKLKQGEQVQVSDAVARHGGYVEKQPQSSAEDWVLRLPGSGVDAFWQEIGKFGQLQYQSREVDLTGDFNRARSELNVLRQREQTLQEALAAQDNADVAAELNEVRSQVKQKEQALAKLNDSVNLARVNLHIQYK